MLVDSNDKKRLKLLLPDRDPICCDLPIIELQKSLFQRCFRIRFFAEPSVFCPKNCTQTAKKAHQNKKKREQKSLSLAESLRFLHELYQPLSILIDQNPASTKDMT